MIRFERILFPLDFSPAAVALAPAVRAMVKRFESDLYVLHVVDVPPRTWMGTPESAAWMTLINADKLRQSGKEALNRFVDEQLSKLPVLPRLSEGDAAAEIAQCAAGDHIDLVMMPAHGFGPFRRLLLGSVTAKVLHDVQCPVWTGVHAEQLAAHPADRWKRALCAIDGDARDLPVLKWAAEFSAEQGLEMRLVHAVSGADPAGRGDQRHNELLFEMAHERIARLQEAAGTAFEVCFLAGSAGHAVHKSATGHDADLVVIGRGAAHTALGRFRGNAYAIIREAPCPVISI